MQVCLAIAETLKVVVFQFMMVSVDVNLETVSRPVFFIANGTRVRRTRLQMAINHVSFQVGFNDFATHLA